MTYAACGCWIGPWNSVTPAPQCARHRDGWYVMPPPDETAHNAEIARHMAEIVRLRTRVAELEHARIALGEMFDFMELKVTRWAEEYEGWQASIHGPFCPCGRTNVPPEDKCHEGCCDPVSITAAQADAFDAAVAAYDRARTPATQEPT